MRAKPRTETINQTQFAALLGISKQAMSQRMKRKFSFPPVPSPLRVDEKEILWAKEDAETYAVTYAEFKKRRINLNSTHGGR